MAITIEELVARSRAAQEQFAFATQEQADAAAKAVCKVVYDNQQELGKLAAEETRMGSVEDKIAKCRNKSSQIWFSIKNRKSVGVINRLEDKRMLEIAKPMGVVASVIPSTNPVVTPMSNAAFSLKCRNSVIFTPHPRAVKCTKLLVELFRAELKKLGFPEDLVLMVEEVSIEQSAKLMAACDIIVATGGMGMVKAAYSSGKPAFGVGQGNVQCILDDDVDLEEAAKKIILGRAFDNGLICLGEQTVFVPEGKFKAFIAALEKNGAYYVEDAATLDKVREAVFPGGGPISRHIVGLTAEQCAELIGLDVPAGTRIIACKVDAVGSADVLCREKMCPVMSVTPYRTFEEGVEMMLKNLNYEGKGHSIGIHSNNKAHVEYAAEKCPVSRVIVNQPCGTTGGGSIKDYVGVGNVPGPIVPMLAIPTTAGTGSEVTASSVITDTQTNFKFSVISYELLPKFAVLDPELVMTAPASIAASCGVDALIHAIEAYLSTAATPFSDTFAEKAMELIGKNLRRFVANRHDREAACAMMVGSTFAGIAFAWAKLGNVHAMSHPVSGFFHVAHGVANSVLLPTVIEYNALADCGRYERIYNYIREDTAPCANFRPEMLVEEVKRLNRQLGIPENLRALGVTEDKIPAMAADAMKAANVLVNPRETNLKEITELYKKAF